MDIDNEIVILNLRHVFRACMSLTAVFNLDAQQYDGKRLSQQRTGRKNIRTYAGWVY